MGRTKYISTPEVLWQYFLDYKEKVKSNPILVHDVRGKDADSVHIEKQRPLTFEGFENYCDDNDLISDLSHYFCNLDNRYSNYIAICSRIKRNIREDQITGGLVGIYNPSITQRLNNLVEKQDVTSNGNTISIPPIEWVNENKD